MADTTSAADTPAGAAAPSNRNLPEKGGGSWPPRNPMPKPLQYVLGVYVVGMFVVLLYLLVKTWPLSSTASEETTTFFWGSVTMALEIRLMLIAALAGGMGAYVHLATSFADYAGNACLTTNWGWWYLIRPFIGMALAEVVYLTLRGGVLNAGVGTTGAISPYGMAAVAALTGMFAKQATDKLREVFENLFRTAEKTVRNDPLSTAPAPSTSGTKALGVGAGGQNL